jgi:DNA (cytosine-5)-methyltransferase 1
MSLRAIELFAGVGGFRLGLEMSGWQTVWSNQWEPGQKAQHASSCYRAHFGESGHYNVDIATIAAKDIPEHDLLVGGFPCQDYSVATANAKGIVGRKGVLWWEIRRILHEKRPNYVLLENVDRLLKSPSAQRGRDFGIMLWCLNDLGYLVEWREINAADYGAPQRRRRVFIFAAQERTPFAMEAQAADDVERWVGKRGFFAKPFAVSSMHQLRLGAEEPHVVLPGDLQSASDRFACPFLNAGLAREGKIWTYKVLPRVDSLVVLGSVLERGVDKRFYIPKDDIRRWDYLKGAKAEKRRAAGGFEYAYTEGPLPFPDPLDRPSRTVLTDEGGLSPSRFKHVVSDPETNELRTLTPVEVERLDTFPDGWTDTGMPERSRYFCLGNAVVVDLVSRMGSRLREISGEPPAPPLSAGTRRSRHAPRAVTRQWCDGKSDLNDKAHDPPLARVSLA